MVRTQYLHPELVEGWATPESRFQRKPINPLVKHFQMQPILRQAQDEGFFCVIIFSLVKQTVYKLITSLVLVSSLLQASTVDRDFIKSFISAYEISPEGRYTHEYHPALLRWTAESMDTLEAYMIKQGLSLDGRMVIMGYEEQAVPQYYTDFTRARINDEAMRKNDTGWSKKLHNRFGYMTGFLFKSINKLTQRFPGKLDEHFEHVDTDMVHLFGDNADILQEHAFGQALPSMLKFEEYIIKLLLKKEPGSVIGGLEQFLQHLYKQSFRVGNSEISATQDVLFSIEYVKHLQRSTLPLVRFFTGPDLTYPIEITNKQAAGATIHAQHFVKTFAPRLNPINNESTVYVFCSFVDGVGKSTMLGNIKNWINHGPKVEDYGHVDNSSSQLAEIFKFKDNVFIADLPAQISHFTYKPDGKVFVDSETELTSTASADVLKYAQEHIAQIKQAYTLALDRIRAIIDSEGHGAPAFNDPNNQLDAFVHNIILLKKQKTNTWYSFRYNDKQYIVHDVKPCEVRCAIPLGRVKSEGLKNIDAEQMLFCEGIRFPFKYTYFIDDLTSRLKAQGVKHVVFVDFLSMYPRSSRENIRINYLLQQMALLHPDFTPRWSLYRDFSGGGGELLDYLLRNNTRGLLLQGFQQETMVRLALFKLLFSLAGNVIDGISLDKMRELLAAEIKKITAGAPDLEQHIATQTDKKLQYETVQLERQYGLSKGFINVQRLAFSHIAAFSSQLEKLFIHDVLNDFVHSLWEKRGTPIIAHDHLVDGELIADRTAKPEPSTTGTAVRVHALFREACRNPQLLTPGIRMLRSNWYAHILNLLYAKEIDVNNQVVLNQERFRAVPVLLQKLTSPHESFETPTAPSSLRHLNQASPYAQVATEDRTADRQDERYIAPEQASAVYAIAQQWFTACTEFVDPKQPPYRSCLPFDLSTRKPVAYIRAEPYYYRYDWSCRQTHTGIMNFDCNILDHDREVDAGLSIVTGVVQKYHNNKTISTVITTSDLWEKAQQDYYWKFDLETALHRARKAGSFDHWLAQQPTSKTPLQSTGKIFLGTDERKPLAQLVVRLLVTLEMVLKDPEADVVVRFGNREDFMAGLRLFEKVVFPRHLSLIFPEDLFDDYESVEPYPSWAFWQQIPV